MWTWVALDADTKMVLSWRVGARDLATAYDLMHDLAERVTGRMQLTTDDGILRPGVHRFDERRPHACPFH